MSYALFSILDGIIEAFSTPDPEDSHISRRTRVFRARIFESVIDGNGGYYDSFTPKYSSETRDISDEEYCRRLQMIFNPPMDR